MKPCLLCKRPMLLAPGASIVNVPLCCPRCAATPKGQALIARHTPQE